MSVIEKFSDPNWRLRNLYKIIDKEARVTLIEPNKAQQDFLDNSTGKDIILKARQLGMSTICLLRMLDRCLFTPNITATIIAHKQRDVQKLFKIIKFAYENFPDEYPKPEAKYNTKSELEFKEINSVIYVDTEVRGDTIQHLHISEMAFMEEAHDKFIATSSAVSPNGTITIETTANGIGNYFYDFYQDAGKRGFTKHFYPWYWADEYREDPAGIEFTKEELNLKEEKDLDHEQLAFYHHKRNLLGEKFRQEYPTTSQEAFISTGTNVFPISVLNEIETKKPLIDTGEMKVWEQSEYGHRYVMGVDVAEGLTQDDSVIDIIDKDTGEQVFHFSNDKIPVSSLAEKIEIYAKKYNNAFIVPEANNHGYALLHMLKQRGLRLYRRESFNGPHVEKTKKYGWNTNRRTKPLMVEALKEAIQEAEVRINHKKTINQLKTYVIDTESGKLQAAPGKKDDCVMSLALAWQGLMRYPSHEAGTADSMEFETHSSEMIAY